MNDLELLNEAREAAHDASRGAARAYRALQHAERHGGGMITAADFALNAALRTAAFRFATRMDDACELAAHKAETEASTR